MPAFSSYEIEVYSIKYENTAKIKLEKILIKKMAAIQGNFYLKILD